MSGGHWNYLSQELEDHAQRNGEVWRLMAALEHELDWGICSDTCLECAKRRAAEALLVYFDSHCQDATLAIAVARDSRQHLCPRCSERERERGK